MEYIESKDRISLMDGEREMAFIEFPYFAEKQVEVTHTVVDDSLRGQGIASQLTRRMADILRREGVKAELTCSYAVRWFAKHPEYADVLIDPEEETEKAGNTVPGSCGIPRHKKI